MSEEKEEKPTIFYRKLNLKWEDPIVDPNKEKVYSFDELPEFIKCDHKCTIAMDEEDRSLTCMGCGKELDPFWVIKHWREIYRRQASYVEAMNEHKAREAERRKKEKERREKRNKEKPGENLY